MPEPTAPAPLWRRLAAAFYDAFLLAAIWMIVALADGLARAALGLPYHAGALRGLLLLSGFAFFGWFWTHGGQTLGMRAWRLRLRRVDGAALSWPQAALRYALAWPSWLLGGAGVLWSLVDARRQTAHDRVAGTEVVLLAAPSPPAVLPQAGGQPKAG